MEGEHMSVTASPSKSPGVLGLRWRDRLGDLGYQHYGGGTGMEGQGLIEAMVAGMALGTWDAGAVVGGPARGHGYRDYVGGTCTDWQWVTKATAGEPLLGT